MSISKAQAAALADGFLDSFGSSKDELRPRETFTEIILISGEFIESAQTNLNKSNSNASGELSASLIANEPVLSGKKLQIDIMMNYYGLFVNKGVKGTKKGRSTAGYSFKYDNPSKKMLDALAEWTKRGKISTSNVKKTYKANESKNQSIGQISNLYALGRSIKQHGIKPTGFLDKAIATTKTKVSSRLGAALKIDIINSITI